jgi:hypothetical protein
MSISVLLRGLDLVLLLRHSNDYRTTCPKCYDRCVFVVPQNARLCHRNCPHAPAAAMKRIFSETASSSTSLRQSFSPRS